MSYEKERSVALQAVREAAELCERVRGDLVAEHHDTKADRSPVTVADFGAQAVVSLRLAEAFPDDPVVGEEASSELPDGLLEEVVRQVERLHPGLGAAGTLAAIDRCNDPGGPRGRRWVLDPIDGTKGFLRGDQYAVALALLEHGEVVLGGLACPRLPLRLDEADGERGCLLLGVRGGGTRHYRLGDLASGVPVAVSATEDASQAVFCESVEASHSSHATHARIAERLGASNEPVRIDSQCKYAAVARGDASIYLRLPTSSTYQEKIWDHAAGWIVVQAAGGRVTDADGRELDFSRGLTLSHNRGIVATNGGLHEQVVRAIRETA